MRRTILGKGKEDMKIILDELKKKLTQVSAKSGVKAGLLAKVQISSQNGLMAG